MEDDQVLSLNCPEFYLIELPGHVWRDRWTALRGPLSKAIGGGLAGGEREMDARRVNICVYRGTSLIRNRRLF